MIHVDAHLDNNEEMFGMKIAHGCPFRRCVEEGLLQNDKVWQIGIRGTAYGREDVQWSKDQVVITEVFKFLATASNKEKNDIS